MILIKYYLIVEYLITLMSYQEEKCPYCKTKDALRSQNTGEIFLDLGIDIVKTVNPLGALRVLGGMTTTMFRNNMLRRYQVCKHCGGFSYFCPKCDDYTKLHSRPVNYQKLRCGECGDVQIFERR